jgi:hypothetical protein
MKPLEFMSFGRFIAFVLPGLVAARAATYLVPSLQRAFTALEGAPGEVAGPIFLVTVAALTVGLTLNAVRRGAVDQLLNAIGRKRARLDYSLLTEEKRERFRDVIEDVYRTYEFTANMALALLLLFGARLAWGPPGTGVRSVLSLAVGGVGLVMLVFSWQELRASYRVMAKILSPQAELLPRSISVEAEPRASLSPPSVDVQHAQPPEHHAKAKDWPPE